MSDGSLRSRAMQGGAIALGGFALTQAINLGAYIALARLASPTDFGLFAAGSIVSGIALLFAESGMLAALITRRDRLEEAANTALLSTVAAGLALVVVSLALAPLVALAFDDGEAGRVTAALSGIPLLRALTVVPDALLQRRLSFMRRLVVEPLGVVAFAVVAIWTCADGAGVWGLVAGTYASMTIQVAAAWAFARWRPRPRAASMAMWRELVGYARPVVLSEIVRRLVTQIDIFLVGRFIGVAALGQYRYAWRLALQPHNAWVSVGAYVLFPVLTRIADDRDRLRAAILRTARWMAIGAFPAGMMLFAIGLPTAVLVFGEEWRDAGKATMALCGFPVGQAVVSLGSEVFKAAGTPRELPRVHLVSGVASTLAMVALLPLGLVGVAAGASVGALVVGAYVVTRLRAVIDLPVRAMASELVPPLVCACAMALAGAAVNGLIRPEEYAVASGLLIVFAEVLALLMFYAALLMAISPARGKELRRASTRIVVRVLGRDSA